MATSVPHPGRLAAVALLTGALVSAFVYSGPKGPLEGVWGGDSPASSSTADSTARPSHLQRDLDVWRAFAGVRAESLGVYDAVNGVSAGVGLGTGRHARKVRRAAGWRLGTDGRLLGDPQGNGEFAPLSGWAVSRVLPGRLPDALAGDRSIALAAGAGMWQVDGAAERLALESRLRLSRAVRVVLNVGCVALWAGAAAAVARALTVRRSGSVKPVRRTKAAGGGGGGGGELEAEVHQLELGWSGCYVACVLWAALVAAHPASVEAVATLGGSASLLGVGGGAVALWCAADLDSAAFLRALEAQHQAAAASQTPDKREESRAASSRDSRQRRGRLRVVKTTSSSGLLDRLLRAKAAWFAFATVALSWHDALGVGLFVLCSLWNSVAFTPVPACIALIAVLRWRLSTHDAMQPASQYFAGRALFVAAATLCSVMLRLWIAAQNGFQAGLGSLLRLSSVSGLQMVRAAASLSPMSQFAFASDCYAAEELPVAGVAVLVAAVVALVLLARQVNSVHRGCLGLAIAALLMCLTIGASAPVSRFNVAHSTMQYYSIVAAASVLGSGVTVLQTRVPRRGVFLAAVALAATVLAATSAITARSAVPHWQDEVHLISEVLNSCGKSEPVAERQTQLMLGNSVVAVPAGRMSVSGANDIADSFCEAFGDNCACHLFRATAAYQHGDDAEGEIRRMLKCPPVHQELAFRSLTLLWNQHVLDETISHVERSPKFFKEKAQVLEEFGQFEMAATCWREVGVLALNDRATEQARAALSKALRLSPDRCDVMYWIAHSHRMDSSTGDALQKYWQALRCATRMLGDVVALQAIPTILFHASGNDQGATDQSFLTSISYSHEKMSSVEAGFSVQDAAYADGRPGLLADLLLSSAASTTNEIVGLYMKQPDFSANNEEKARILLYIGDACKLFGDALLLHSSAIEGNVGHVPVERSERSMHVDKLAIRQWNHAGQQFLLLEQSVAAAKAFGRSVAMPDSMTECDLHVYYATAILKYLVGLDEQVKQHVGARGATSLPVLSGRRDSSSAHLSSDGQVLQELVVDALSPHTGANDEDSNAPALRLETAILHLQKALPCPEHREHVRATLAQLGIR